MIHSRFSPASMPRDLLERTFVQREDLAKRLVDLFAESALGESKHRVLLVGPRGVGKSHLVSVVYHRLRELDPLRDRLIIAFLREDEWGITSFLDLLIRILRALGTEPAGISSLSSEEAEQQVWGVLREQMRDKTLLVIAENLDTILSALGEEGQRKWRALIQTHCCWAVLATTPALSGDISSQAAPFYGFFEVQHLGGLSVSDAVRLLKKLAASQGNAKIAGYLDTPACRAKVRAVQHLANGNHRIFVIFYEFLAADFEDLLNPLLRTIDSLTPYYQSRIKDLSPQQRKLVEFLCEHRLPATVKAIASSCFVSQQTAASQLKQLLEARYVRVTRIGRESYYELNEPLLRICVEVKSRDGQPLRLLVEFLRYWFSRQELAEKVASAPADSLRRTYLAAALKEYESDEGHTHLSPDVARLCRTLGKVGATGDKQALWAAAEELAEVSRIAEDWLHYTRALSYLGRTGEALGPILEEYRCGRRTPALLHALARAYQGAGQFQLALSTFEEAAALSPRRDLVLLDKGLLLEKIDRNEEALAAYSEAVRIDSKWYHSRLLKASLLLKMEQPTEAEPLLRGILAYGERDPDIFCDYGCALAARGEVRKAMKYFVKATDLMPKDAEAWRLLGQSLFHLKRPLEALNAAARARELDPTSSIIQDLYCKILFTLKHYKRAIAELPTDLVAHQVFHQMLDIEVRHKEKRTILRALSRLRSHFAEGAGSEAFWGALVEFARCTHEQASKDEIPELRIWHTVLTEMLRGQGAFDKVLRLFDLVIQYKESGDQRILMQLPLEERQLLLSKKHDAALGESGDG